MTEAATTAPQPGPNACGAFAAAAATGADVQEVFAFAGHTGQDRAFSLPEISGFLAAKGYCLLQAAMFSTPEFSEDPDTPAPLAVGSDAARRLRQLADRRGTNAADLLAEILEASLGENGLAFSAEEIAPPTWGKDGLTVKRQGLTTGFYTRIPLLHQTGLVATIITGLADGHWLYFDGTMLWDPSRPPGQQATCWHRHRIGCFIPISYLAR